MSSSITLAASKFAVANVRTWYLCCHNACVKYVQTKKNWKTYIRLVKLSKEFLFLNSDGFEIPIGMYNSDKCQM